MSHIKIRFEEDLGIIDREFASAVNEMFRIANPLFTIREHRWRPQMDIYEAADEVMILVELAGVSGEDLQVEVGRRTVKISGRRRERPLDKAVRYRLAEISYGYFERVLTLPVPVDTESASATFSEGFLMIRLSKLPVDQIRKISVRNG
ncbi:MAG: Hsp20/alpha crystallin family protein [Deltaproteobacteria bacterium]|nr:Hsp20/alpha crystallin family protein [Deltaproteobacteria bacterium]